MHTGEIRELQNVTLQYLGTRLETPIFRCLDDGLFYYVTQIKETAANYEYTMVPVEEPEIIKKFEREYRRHVC